MDLALLQQARQGSPFGPVILLGFFALVVYLIIIRPNRKHSPQGSFQGAVEIRCKVCEKGMLTPQRIHRMSGPAVVIGYILLIPSIMGIFMCVLTLIASANAAHDFPGQGGPQAGCLGGCLGVGGLIAFFVGGLLGWLLVMKKDVLKCGVCGSVIARS